MSDYKKILVAVDFGDSSRNTLEQAMAIATAFGSEVTVLHVFEYPSYAYGGTPVTIAEWIGAVRGFAEKELERFLDSVHALAPNANGILRGGEAATQILAAADEIQPDLVVLGRHRPHPVRHLLLGHVAERVVRCATVPVLTVPPRSEERAKA
jgi:nucleotide-binding universal stress UspA family protein